MVKLKGNLVDQIHEILREKIVNLELKPGTRIDFQGLTEKFGVSQTPIRDALRKLSEDGLVTIVSRVGYYVVKPSIRDMEEIYELRKLFEGHALKFAIKKNTSGIEELKKRTEKLRSEPVSKRKKTKFTKLDRELHWLIIRSCNNKRLQELFFQIYDFVIMSQHMVEKIDIYLDEHIALMDAMLQGDIAKAQKILEVHIDNAKSEVTKIVKMNYQRRD